MYIFIHICIYKEMNGSIKLTVGHINYYYLNLITVFNLHLIIASCMKLRIVLNA